MPEDTKYVVESLFSQKQYLQSPQIERVMNVLWKCFHILKTASFWMDTGILAGAWNSCSKGRLLQKNFFDELLELPSYICFKNVQQFQNTFSHTTFKGFHLFIIQLLRTAFVMTKDLGRTLNYLCIRS